MGFEVWSPAGSYYIMTGIRSLTELDDVSFAMELVSNGGVATVPGSSFFSDPQRGAHIVRFCFAKRLDTLQRAADELRRRLT